MMRKHIKLLVLLFAFALLFTGCTHSSSVKESDIIGKTYTYEKEGFGGDFTIQIKDDGTFYYYEGGLSSHIGIGKWTLEGDTLLLSEDVESAHAKENYFKVDGRDLLFVAESSTNFLYIKVADNERFSGSPTETE